MPPWINETLWLHRRKRYLMSSTSYQDWFTQQGRLFASPFPQNVIFLFTSHLRFSGKAGGSQSAKSLAGLSAHPCLPGIRRWVDGQKFAIPIYWHYRTAYRLLTVRLEVNVPSTNAQRNAHILESARTLLGRRNLESALPQAVTTGQQSDEALVIQIVIQIVTVIKAWCQ